MQNSFLTVQKRKNRTPVSLDVRPFPTSKRTTTLMIYKWVNKSSVRKSDFQKCTISNWTQYSNLSEKLTGSNIQNQIHVKKRQIWRVRQKYKAKIRNFDGYTREKGFCRSNVVVSNLNDENLLIVHILNDCRSNVVVSILNDAHSNVERCPFKCWMIAVYMLNDVILIELIIELILNYRKE